MVDSFSEIMSGTAYGRVMNIQITALTPTAAVSIAGSHAPSKRAASVAFCRVIKLHIFRVAFYGDLPEANLHNYHAVKSASPYSTTVRWMEYILLTKMDLKRQIKNTDFSFYL